jgi:hypothetical protein
LDNEKYLLTKGGVWSIISTANRTYVLKISREKVAKEVVQKYNEGKREKERMMKLTEIIVALITGGMSLAGVVITSLSQRRKIEHRLQVSQAVTETKLEELTREVREHNNYARRVPVLEEQMRVANHRIRDLEDKL